MTSVHTVPQTGRQVLLSAARVSHLPLQRIPTAVKNALIKSQFVVKENIPFAVLESELAEAWDIYVSASRGRRLPLPPRLESVRPAGSLLTKASAIHHSLPWRGS